MSTKGIQLSKTSLKWKNFLLWRNLRATLDADKCKFYAPNPAIPHLNNPVHVDLRHQLGREMAHHWFQDKDFVE